MDQALKYRVNIARRRCDNANDICLDIKIWLLRKKDEEETIFVFELTTTYLKGKGVKKSREYQYLLRFSLSDRGPTQQCNIFSVNGRIA